jgi:hypothetical protein
MQFKVLVMAKALLTPHGWDQLEVHRCDPVWPFVCREVRFFIPEGAPPDELRQAAQLAKGLEVGGTMVVHVDKNGLDPNRRRPVLGSLLGEYVGAAKRVYQEGPRTITFLMGFGPPEPNAPPEKQPLCLSV